jgi:hypothetical protein
MTKPILWLGPLEELDADFDPLLGRSATQAPPQVRTSTPKPALDPSRSVFDDPVAESPNLAVPAPPVFDAQPDQNDTDLNDTGGSVSQRDAAPAPVAPYNLEEPLQRSSFDDGLPEEQETNISDEVADEPLHSAQGLGPEPVSATDFTHNNEPIPARQDVAAPVSALSAHEPELDVPSAQEPVVPKKSFFASLFSSRDITPADTRESASINDIWAKSTAEPNPEPEVEIEGDVEAQTEAEITLVPPNEPPETVPYAANTPLRGRNIWADIDTTADDERPAQIIPSEPEPLAVLEGEIVGEDTIDSETISVDTRETAAMLEAAEDGSVAENLADTSPLEPDAIIAPEPLELNEGQPEAELAPQIVAQPEATSSSPFQNAFNADQFWALPRGANPPEPLVQGPEAEPELQSPEAHAPELQVPESEDLVPAQALPDGDGVGALDATATPALEMPPEATEPPVALPQEEPAPAIAASKARPATTGKRRKRKVKKNYVGAFLGTSLFMFALVMTMVSGISALGYPFDMISSYRWYWVILSVLAAGIFGLSRGWKMVAASFIVMAANLFVTVPATGKAPSGGNTATAVVGWANVAGNSDALARIFKDAEKKKATLLMLAEAPQSVFTPPAGWTLIEAPVAGDPTAIAVLSNSTWRAVTVPGEPTMARPAAADLTIIALHPHDALKWKRSTPIREAQINRAGTRAGYQEGPTVVLGDFNASPWDSAITQFRSYGNVTRVRCGGWAGSTLTQAFGFIGVATDHAFVRDVKVTHCQLGNPLTGGNHKPIWLYVAPQAAKPEPVPSP